MSRIARHTLCKRKSSLWAVLILCAALLLSACGSRGGEAPERGPGEIAQSILDNVEFRDALLEAEGEIAGNYYSLDSAVTDFSIYISGSGATAEEVAVLRVDKEEDLDKAVEALNKRVESQKTRFENYVPEEMNKLNRPVLVTAGRTAVLVLSDDGGAEDAARRAMAGE